MFIALGGIIFYGSSFTFQRTDATLYAIAQSYQQQLNMLQVALSEYLQASENADIPALKSAHLNTRIAFKYAEPLLNYFEPTAVKKQLNGAPLPWVKYWGGKKKVMPPKGLQVLDELVFGEITKQELEQIRELVAALHADYKEVRKRENIYQFKHQRVFLATREELVRIFTLGLTGFDTPGSQNALPEAAAALKSTAAIIENYTILLSPTDSLSLQINTLFAKAIQSLENAENFNDFDRLSFLKKYINPLYGAIHDLHYQLGTAYFDDPLLETGAVNYYAKNLFSEDFLRAGYYLKSDLKNDLGELRSMLGERLFFDKQLSVNEKISCATCHQPNLAFTDGVAKSIANDGEQTVRRNSPTLINSVYATRYFYDLREPLLENQMRHVVLDSLEFATDFPTIIKKITADTTYVEAFMAAYQLPNTNLLAASHINNAIATYIAGLTALNSPFDQFIRGENNDLSLAAQRGFNLFMGKAACGTCHFAPTFSGIVPPFYNDTETEVLGVPTTPDTINVQLDMDVGRYESGFPIDKTDFYKNSFKTVTLRNVALTAPYMHNGIYASLEEVIDFYDRGGGIGLGMDVPNQTLSSEPLHLTSREKKDLVAFMKSLSDNPYAFRD